jgi:hypothetical protein
MGFRLRVVAWDGERAQPSELALVESNPLTTTRTNRVVRVPSKPVNSHWTNQSHAGMLTTQANDLADAAELNRNDGYNDGQVVYLPTGGTGPWNACTAISVLNCSISQSGVSRQHAANGSVAGARLVDSTTASINGHLQQPADLALKRFEALQITPEWDCVNICTRWPVRRT